MTETIVRIYDYLGRNRKGMRLSLLLTGMVLACLVFRQTYQEDISDFLPLNNKYHRALKVYQDISAADRIIVIFELRDTAQTDPDRIVEAIGRYADLWRDAALPGNPGDSIALTCRIDSDLMTETARRAYEQAVYHLTAADYERMDSLLSREDYVATQMAEDKQMLMFPIGGLLSENLQRDPLNLLTPVAMRQLQTQAQARYEDYDGYIFTPDMKMGLVMLKSPFGASETENNGQLIQLLQQTAEQTMADFADVDIRLTGGPVIAVGNSNQIKTDSLVSVLLAVLLIVALLYSVFRRFKDLLLIILSIAWGWLFAMGALAVIHDRVSVIVIGISSVILGIAVNYPLHLIAHLQHTPDMKSALKEIAMPLVVGNITTVGAFFALVPLKSAALRDLGLFSSFLLIGTILFVLFCLPHLCHKPQTSNPRPQTSNSILQRLSNWNLECHRWVVIPALLLTFIFAYYSLDTSFDPNMSHINYMTDEQRRDMASLQQMVGEKPTETVYVVSPARPRLALWEKFVGKYGEMMERQVTVAARQEGFAEGTFDEFFRLLQAPPAVCDSIIDVLEVRQGQTAHVIDSIEAAVPGCYAFDVAGMNSSIATRLSDDFNYIGWACGLIVFLFLWFSLGSIELALLSFLPMAVSWIWILGIMSLAGIQFNVVNVILATFIFGQGDDYTIFMTEGCQYEFAHRRKMLASYKTSIIISALIMFIGIGTLIFARHPALRSLAEVTIVGMFSVVLMAFVFPPLIFRWLVTDGQTCRRRPVTLASLVGFRRADDNLSLVRDIYRYKGVEISAAVNKSLRNYRNHGDRSLDSDGEAVDQGPVPVILRNTGWGEIALLMALENPSVSIVAVEPDEERRRVAQYAAEVAAPNLTFVESLDHKIQEVNDERKD